MPSRLRRSYGFGDVHLITCSCYRRKPLLGSAVARDLSLKIFEQVRRKYHFEVIGYVVMPEHFHLLMGEPEFADPSTVLQVVKRQVAKAMLKSAAPADSRHVWYTRFYDFNVQSEEKIIEKLRYMHRNPVRRGLVDLPEKWACSSFVAYWSGAQGVVWIERLNPNPTVTRTDRSTFDGPTS